METIPKIVALRVMVSIFVRKNARYCIDGGEFVDSIFHSPFIIHCDLDSSHFYKNGSVCFPIFQ